MVCEGVRTCTYLCVRVCARVYKEVGLGIGFPTPRDHPVDEVIRTERPKYGNVGKRDFKERSVTWTRFVPRDKEKVLGERSGLTWKIQGRTFLWREVLGLWRSPD